MARASRCALALIAALVAAHCCAVQARTTPGGGRTLLKACSGSIPAGSAYGGEKAEGVGDYTKTCHDPDNVQCKPCDLWRKAKEGTDVCLQHFQQDNCKKGFWVAGLTGDSPLALPTTAIRGIEDMVSGSKVIKQAEIWQQVWDYAIANKLIKEDTGALVINSANYRSEHQMHIHMGAMEPKLFQATCVNKVIPTSSFDHATELPCEVQQFVKSGGSWQAQGSKPAFVKAIRVSSLSDVWKAYVDGGKASYPNKGDEYHTGLAVMRNPKNSKQWLVMAFSSRTAQPGTGAVGDYELQKH